MFLQKLWAFKLKSAAGQDTINSLRHILQVFVAPTIFMADGGPHFNCDEVHNFCRDIGMHLHIAAAYSPWINGLLEQNNSILLNALKQLCRPSLGEVEYEKMVTKDIPKNWPDHLDTAIKHLTDHILPALKFSPNKLLLTIPTTIPPIVDPESINLPGDPKILLHLSIAKQQCLDGYDSIVNHTTNRKARFNAKVLKHTPRQVVFEKGDLVQVHQSQWHNTFIVMRKMVPMWSVPNWVASRLCNSYTLETIGGLPIAGVFNVRHLQAFEPRLGTKLTLDELERLEMLEMLETNREEDKEVNMAELDTLWGEI